MTRPRSRPSSVDPSSSPSRFLPGSSGARTGFSSLAYLTRFPIDKIKIDRSFVRDLIVDVADAAIVDTIIAMAHTLGMGVVAEGIESDDQREYLQARDCDEAQGFLFSKAIGASEFVEAVRAIGRR